MIRHDQVSNDNGLGIRRRPPQDGNGRLSTRGLLAIRCALLIAFITPMSAANSSRAEGSRGTGIVLITATSASGTKRTCCCRTTRIGGCVCKRVNFEVAEGFPSRELRDVRLQPPQHQIPPCESWRPADDARLWHWHARVFGVGRHERSGLPSTRNGVVVCRRGHVLSYRTVGLVA